MAGAGYLLESPPSSQTGREPRQDRQFAPLRRRFRLDPEAIQNSGLVNHSTTQHTRKVYLHHPNLFAAREHNVLTVVVANEGAYERAPVRAEPTRAKSDRQQDSHDTELTRPGSSNASSGPSCRGPPLSFAFFLFPTREWAQEGRAESSCSPAVRGHYFPQVLYAAGGLLLSSDSSLVQLSPLAAATPTRCARTMLPTRGS